MKATTKDNLAWRVACEYGATQGKFDLAACAKKIAESELPLNKNDKIIITGGVTPGESGNTNLIKIEKI